MEKEKIMKAFGEFIRFEMNRIVEETEYFDMAEMQEKVTMAVLEIRSTPAEGYKNSISDAAKKSNNATVQRWYRTLTEMYRTAKKNDCQAIAAIVEELAKMPLSYEQKCCMMNALEKRKEKKKEKKNPYKKGSEYWKIFEEYAKLGEYLTYKEIRDIVEWDHWIKDKTEEMEIEEERARWLVEPWNKKEDEYAGRISDEEDAADELIKAVRKLNKWKY